MTEELSGRLLRLPFYYGLTEDEQGRVVDGIRTFLEARTARPAVGASRT